MTEEMAKTKWCPHSRNNACNRNSPLAERVISGEFTILPEGTNCVGSDCIHGCDRKGQWFGHCRLDAS